MAGISEENRQEFEAAVVPVFDGYRLQVRTHRREKADRVGEVARRLAPRLRHADPRWFPGETAASIAVEHFDDRSEVTVGVRWAAFLEFGTSKMRPYPFLRPAIAEVAGRDE